MTDHDHACRQLLKTTRQERYLIDLLYLVSIIETTVTEAYETSSNLFNVHPATIKCTGTETHLANCSTEADGSEDDICKDNDGEDVAGVKCRIGKYSAVIIIHQVLVYYSESMHRLNVIFLHVYVRYMHRW